MATPRLLCIAGKGGVGKTTVAAATAAATARERRCLVVSLDRAHNLGDVLRAPLGPDPAAIPGQPNLWAAELDPQAELSRHWSAIAAYCGRFLRYLGLGGAVAEEMAVLPGLEELLTLSRLAELLETDAFDLVIADFAPTASSLRYLSLPELLHGAFGRFFELDRKAARLLRPLPQRVIKLPVPEEAVYEGVTTLAARLDRLRALLADPAQAVVRLVMIPERVALEETRRALGYLGLFGLNVDAVVVNRLLPPEALQGYFAAWGQIQEGVLADARASFADFALLSLRAQPDEVLGVAALRALAAELYGDRDPAAAYTQHSPFQYGEEAGRPVLRVALPTVAAGAPDLRRRERELILTVGGWRRLIPLPDSLAGRPIERARQAAGSLTIVFAASEKERPRCQP